MARGAQSIDLRPLSDDDLRELAARIETELDSRDKQAKSAALEDMKAAAAKVGMKPADLLAHFGLAPKSGSQSSATKPRTRVPKGEPKYANPADASQTWTGRGRKPLWVEAHLANVGELEALAI